jgi:hypothetical protein
MAPEGLPDPLRVALGVGGIFERLGVPYVTAGSFASSLHGEPRSTDGIDMVADLRPAHAAALATALRGEWYLSEEAVRDAITRGTSFNAIHLATGVKVDVFVVGADAFDAQRVASGRTVRIGDDPSTALRVDTPEYTILRKLEWFRRGGESSDRQWRDVIGIIRTQGVRLDRGEFSTWAGRLGVSDLLARALEAAGAPGSR